MSRKYYKTDRRVTLSNVGTRGPGRPRSAAARRAILAASTQLIESEGYGNYTKLFDIRDKE